MTSIPAIIRTKHHWLLIASVIACLQTGCGDPHRSKIVGNWQIAQTDTLMSRIQQNESEARPGEYDPDKEPPKMVVSFRRNGQLTTSTRLGDVIQEKQGTWTMVAFDEPNQTIKVTCSILDQETEHAVKFLDPDTIELIPPNLAGTKMKLKFKRQD